MQNPEHCPSGGGGDQRAALNRRKLVDAEKHADDTEGRPDDAHQQMMCDLREANPVVKKAADQGEHHTAGGELFGKCWLQRKAQYDGKQQCSCQQHTRNCQHAPLPPF